MAATKKGTSLKKISTQEASVNSTNEGKGKAIVKDTRNLDTCPICMQTFEKVHYDMGDWIKCHFNPLSRMIFYEKKYEGLQLHTHLKGPHANSHALFL